VLHPEDVSLIVAALLTLNLALFLAVYIECSVFSSMGVFHLTTLAFNGYVFL
jgi:hypothetical protein